MPSRRKRAKKDLEKTPFYKNASAILALISAAVVIIYTSIAILETQFFNPTPVGANIQIVVDRSAIMGTIQGKNTRWHAVKNAVNVALQTSVAQKDNLALRAYGGDCYSDTNTQLAVNFSQHNKSAVRQALEELKPEGESTLVSAIIEATGDFNDPEKFPPSTKKSIIVIAGSNDDCHSNPGQSIGHRFKWLYDKSKALQLDFHIIGYDIPEDQRGTLKRIAEFTGGSLTQAKTPAELSNKIQSVITERARAVTPDPMVAASYHRKEKQVAPFVAQTSPKTPDNFQFAISDSDKSAGARKTLAVNHQTEEQQDIRTSKHTEIKDWGESLHHDATRDLLDSLKSSNDEPNNKKTKNTHESERLIETFVELILNTNKAQILLTSAFDLNEDTAALQTEQKALQNGTVKNQHELKKILKHSIQVNKVIQTKLQAGENLSDKGSEAYTKSLLLLTETISKLKNVKQDTAKLALDFRNRSPGLFEVVSDARTTLFFSQETPMYLTSLYETSKAMVTYAIDNNIDIPDDVQGELSNLP